jgi:processing peptidase subunit alpha
LITEIEKLGGIVQCVSTRENLIYCMDVLKENTEQAFSLFADSLLNPLYPTEELDEARVVVQLQQEELPSEIFSRDLCQQAGYRGYPLGNNHFCPVDKVNNVTTEQIQLFRRKYLRPHNVVLSGAGIDHISFKELSGKYFSKFPTITTVEAEGVTGDANSGKDSLVIERPSSKYTGGMLTNQRKLKEPFVKLAMAFEVGGWKSDDLIAVCVIQQLLGGGSSFSAGGPGKGMYSRLFTQVLNRHYWAESVESFLSIHEEHGLLGIDGACPPQNLAHLIKTIVEQFSDLAIRPISTVELNRSKNMLKSMMMMQLESRLVVCEDIARQFITFGKREDPIVICEKIDKVTEKDIMEVAKKMMNCVPSIGVVGEDLSHVPKFEDIQRFTENYYQELLSKNTVYR